MGIRLRSGNGALNRIEYHLTLHGFCDVFDGACRRHALLDLGRIVTCEYHHGQVSPACSQSFKHGKAVHLLHVQIEDHAVDMPSAEHLQKLLARGEYLNVEAGSTEQSPQRQPDRRVIINDDNDPR